MTSTPKHDQFGRRQAQRASGASSVAADPSDPDQLAVFDAGEALRRGRKTGRVILDTDQA